MFISELCIENFRCFGQGKNKLVMPLQLGLNTLVGENDAGKTAIIDAMRMLLGTRDQESLRPSIDDFHYADSKDQAKSLSIAVTFLGLTLPEQVSFAEYLTYQPEDTEYPVVLKVTLQAVLRNDKVRTTIFSGLPTSSHGLKEIDTETRDKLRSTYLRPLRDAEKEMDAGKNSRISKILKRQSEIDEGESTLDFSAVLEDKFGEVVEKLGVVGIARLVNQLLEGHPAVNSTTNELNVNFLKPLQMLGDNLQANLGIGPNADDEMLKRQMLEKIGIALDNVGGKRGLGSNNLLYIACEMLLLSDSKDELALLIIEEPEAHLHPQRQLKLIQYLQDKVNKHKQEHEVHLQVLLSTHSPTLASKLPIKCMTMVHKGKVLPLSMAGSTESDYTFLERFIDATKSNLFFCRGLMIVEGDAENLLLPSVAKILGLDFTENGVSIVNVGHTGLSRYANVFSGTREYPNPGIKVACLHDLDLIPYNAARELKLDSVKNNSELSDLWDSLKSSLDVGGEVAFEPLNTLLPKNVISFFEEDPFDKSKITNVARDYNGSFVKGFYSGPWTLEYSLAFHGLGKEVTTAACLAKAEPSTRYDPSKHEQIVSVAEDYYDYLNKTYSEKEVLAGKVYELFLSSVNVSTHIENKHARLVLSSKASKAAAGQHLGQLLEMMDQELESSGYTQIDRIEHWKSLLPIDVVEAIEHVIPLMLSETESE
ncbi:AAA family ATPase [Vibrio diabolicus]|uniref:ATP-dependent nuclease n=1 Tax=Vibrio diabolicus TaxID=50719 RepID=UPI00215E3A2F|nr:AAA family ATPase [Vibrio diabolicus]MCS0337175.1 AAA family ATPase [Vibrio diabolicus]